MRMLHKMLRRLTPEDVMQLSVTSVARSKKNNRNTSSSSPFEFEFGKVRNRPADAHKENAIASEQTLPEVGELRISG